MSEPFLKPGVWYDPDQAACAMALNLGIYAHSGTTFGPAKWVFVSNNLIGEAMHNLIQSLASCGILDENDDGQYRWNPEYDPSSLHRVATQ